MIPKGRQPSKCGHRIWTQVCHGPRRNLLSAPQLQVTQRARGPWAGGMNEAQPRPQGSAGQGRSQGESPDRGVGLDVGAS